MVVSNDHRVIVTMQFLMAKSRDSNWKRMKRTITHSFYAVLTRSKQKLNNKKTNCSFFLYLCFFLVRHHNNNERVRSCCALLLLLLLMPSVTSLFILSKDFFQFSYGILSNHAIDASSGVTNS